MISSTSRRSASAAGAFALAAACGLAAPAPHAAAQLTEPFPAVFELESLTAAGGGDGSLGVVLETSILPFDDLAGYAVAGAGDINGDGLDDAVIGAPGYYYQSPTYGALDKTGRAYVLFGRAGGFGSPTIQLHELSGADGFRFDGGEDETPQTGASVGSAGDVNGDGADDLIVGAPNADEAYVIYGRSVFPPVLDRSILLGVSGGFRLSGAERTGSSVASAGDVDGDGRDDLVIGAPFADGIFRNAGESYVVFGLGAAFPASLSLTSLGSEAGFRIPGDAASDVCGISVASAGDLNADGQADFVVGASGADPFGLTGAGQSYIVFGRAGGGFGETFDPASLDGTNGFRAHALIHSGAGSSVAPAGDVNADGIDDLIISSRLRAYIVFGRDLPGGASFPADLDLTTLDGQSGFQLEGDAILLSSVHSVAGAGDVNGDGIDDVIVGDSYASGGVGRCYVVYGRDTASGPGFPPVVDVAELDGSDGFRIFGFTPGGYAGHSVASAGDVNGDGIDDLIIGAPDTYGTNGRAYIIYGRNAPCYADCDGSGSLDFFDFLCFQNQFAAGDPQADCDESGELDFFDFLCFQNAFAAGCP